VSWAQFIVGLVIAQRAAELVWSERNRLRLMAEGGQEVGQRHYPLFVVLHGAWLVAMLVSDPRDPDIVWPLIALFVFLQFGRLWVLATLGRLWTTRIVTLPHAPLVRTGPYRYLNHPNYLIVAVEIPLLPMALGQALLAAAFGAANLALLAWRVRIENEALAPRRSVA
jgi:methyltransferase